MERLIQLPPLTQVTLFVDNRPLLEAFAQSDPDLHPHMEQLFQLLRRRFSAYDIGPKENFTFAFPPTSFEEAAETPIEYRQRMQVEENTFSSRLTPEQFAQMAKDGTFLVPSKLFSIPYKWTVHPALLQGADNRQRHWFEDLARAYHQLRQVGKRLSGETLSILLNLSELRLYPVRIANLLVGARQMRVALDPDLGRILEIAFLLLKFDTYFEKTCHALEDYLYQSIAPTVEAEARAERGHEVQRRVEELRAADLRFDRQWRVQERALIKEYKRTTAEPKAEEIRAVLREKKRESYAAFLEGAAPPALHESIFYLLRMFLQFQLAGESRAQQLAEARTRIEQGIRSRHRIRSLDCYFMGEELQRQFAPVERGLEEEYRRTLKERLASPLYDEYLKHLYAYDQRLRELQTRLPPVLEPQRVFHSSYPLFPPFKVVLVEVGGYKYFQLEKEIKLRVDTSRHFWKFRLYGMRVYSWTRTCFFWLVVNAWVGPLGLKVLFSLGSFRVDQQIDSRTGEISYSYQDGLYVQFGRVLAGIARSRADFEALPDTGFLGKNISRLLNLAECYLFRLLFVGVLLLLVLKPLLILLNVALSVALVLTEWAWLPLLLTLTYLFNVLIFQFEIDTYGLGLRRFSERFIPLLNTPLMLVLNLVRIAVYAVGIAVVHPLLALLCALWAAARLAARTCSDYAVLTLFRLLARTPARDTAVAWKVSGPGLSQRYYRSLREDDIFILVLAELERQYLHKFREQVQERIDRPLQQLNSTMQRFAGVYDCSYNNNSTNQVREASNRLSTLFSRQFSNFMRRYPRLDAGTVRFSASELELYFENTVGIVRSFVEKRECWWMFARNRVEEPRDYEQLTKELWLRVFGPEIFEPLEDLDLRFELKTEGDSYKKEAVMRALEGEVKLVRSSPSTIAELKTFHVGEIPLVRLGEVVASLRQCSGWGVPSSIREDTFSVLFNPNIREVVAGDEQRNRYDRFRRELL